MYWDLILKEINDKDCEKRLFALTNLQEIRAQRLAANAPIIKEEKLKPSKKTYLLGAKFPNIYFTKREAECMEKFLCGKTIAKTAEDLKLSPRTIEYYLKNMKAKLICHSKFELINRVIDSDFVKNLDF